MALSVVRYKAEQEFDKARRMLVKEEYSRSFFYLDKALKLNPYCMQYRDLMGFVKLRVAYEKKDLDLLDDAVWYAIDTTVMYPDNYYSYFTAGKAYHIYNDKVMAVLFYRRALKLNPFKPEIKERLAKLL